MNQSFLSSRTANFLLLGFLFVSGNVHAERQIANYQEFTAILNDDQSCSENMSIVARHPSPSAFTEQRAQLQRLLGGVRIVLNLECPQVNELLITGEVADNPVYRGVFSSSTEWMLIDTPGAAEEKVVKSQKIVIQVPEQTDIKQVGTDDGIGCDQFAASQTKLANVKIGMECISIDVFDRLLDKSVSSNNERISKQGDSFNPAMELRKSIYSAKQLRDVGLWYLKNANNPFGYEKAFWYFSAAYTKANKNVAINKGTHSTDELYVGQAAAIAAAEYVNPKSNAYDLDRAFSLHYEAGFWGIQSSFVAAAYILRFQDNSEYAKRWGHPPEAFIATERMLFRKATNCSEENLSRKVFPFTQELCDIAQNEALNAEKRFQAAYRRTSDGNAVAWFFMGLVGLAMLGADNGAPPEDIDLGQQAYQAEQKRIQRQINEDLAIGWATAGTKW